MYPSCPDPCPSPPSPCNTTKCPCKVDGFPRPPGCQNETSGLWVYPQYNVIFEPGRLGPDTKLLLVPPTWGSRMPCTAAPNPMSCEPPLSLLRLRRPRLGSLIAAAQARTRPTANGSSSTAATL